MVAGQPSFNPEPSATVTVPPAVAVGSGLNDQTCLPQPACQTISRRCFRRVSATVRAAEQSIAQLPDRDFLPLKRRIAGDGIKQIRLQKQAGGPQYLPAAANLHQQPPIGSIQFMRAAQAPEKLLGAIEQPPAFLPVHQSGQPPQEDNDRGQHEQAGDDQSRPELRMIALKIAPHFAPFFDLSQGENDE
jgi:hypothetical protein